MPVISFTKDPAALTMTVISEFPVPVQRLWDAYADPRQLEKFWGPVEWPATFVRHDFAVGGRSDYYMTGPEGKGPEAYWKFLSVDPGKSFEVEDGFTPSDDTEHAGVPPMRMLFTFEPTGSWLPGHQRDALRVHGSPRDGAWNGHGRGHEVRDVADGRRFSRISPPSLPTSAPARRFSATRRFAWPGSSAARWTRCGRRITTLTS